MVLFWLQVCYRHCEASKQKLEAYTIQHSIQCNIQTITESQDNASDDMEQEARLETGLRALGIMGDSATRVTFDQDEREFARTYGVSIYDKKQIM